MTPRKPNRHWMCLATLAVAESQILCVVPSRWPPSRSLEAVASTWLNRAFLGRFASSDPLTFGQCACERSPGMHFV